MEVKLIQWNLDHTDSLMEICNSVDRRYLSNRIPYPYTEECAHWWIGMATENEGNNGIYRAIVADGKIVGNISVERKTDVYDKDGEIGYLLSPTCSSRGIMTEAVKQICEIAFSELNIIRITGLVYEPNIASRKVLEKNGFMLEGIMKRAVSKDDNIYNLCVYGKVK